MLGLNCRGGFRCFGTLGKVDFAAEDRIVFNRKPQRTHIAFNGATRPQFDAAAGYDVSVDLPLNQYVPSRKVRGNVCAWADGEPALGQSYGSFDTPIDDQVFRAFDFPTNDDGLAYPSRTIFGCHGSIPFQNYLISPSPKRMASIALETSAVPISRSSKTMPPGNHLVA
jgi:hypothetical protein